MPVVETLLRKNVERVSEFLKSLQVTTRFLHKLCCHSKVKTATRTPISQPNSNLTFTHPFSHSQAIKNTAIIVQIPGLRETVEQFVFKVKAALAANKCSSVFSMGNLKNKNLYDEDIASQASSITRTSSEDDDDGVADRTDDDDAAEVVSDAPTCGDSGDGAGDGEGNDNEEPAQPSTSTNERARRSRIGPNRSRSRELTFNRK